MQTTQRVLPLVRQVKIYVLSTEMGVHLNRQITTSVPLIHKKRDQMDKFRHLVLVRCKGRGHSGVGARGHGCLVIQPPFVELRAQKNATLRVRPFSSEFTSTSLAHQC